MRRNPLAYAILNGHYDACVLLITHNTKNTDGLITLAAKMGHVKICELLLNTGIGNVNDALHSAIEGGHHDICELLIAYGADVNLTISNIGTPLHMAVQHRRSNICQLLMDHDADIYEIYDNIGTPLHLAAALGYKNICKIFIDVGMNPDGHISERPPLLDALEYGNYDICKYLICHGADTTTSCWRIDKYTAHYRGIIERLLHIVSEMLKEALHNHN